MIFVGPPDARSDALSRGHDEILAEIVSAPRDAANPRRILCYGRDSFVEHFDIILDSLRQLLFKRHPIDVSFALEFELRLTVRHLRYGERQLEIDLHLAAGFDGLESDRVRP